MQPIDLNLSSRPFRNNSLLWLGFALGFVLVVAASYWNYTTYDRVQSEYARLGEGAAACLSCTGAPCATACPYGLPVGALTRDAHRTLALG